MLPNEGEASRPNYPGAPGFESGPAREAARGAASHAAAAPPAALSNAPTAASLMKALHRRWLLASSLSLACALGVAAGVWFLLPPPKNTAAAQLRIRVEEQGNVFKHPDAIDNFANFQATQAALVRSRMVLVAALRPPQVARLETLKHTDPPDPVEWLEKELKVDFKASKEIMTVSLAGENTEELKILVDAVTETYLREVVGKYKERRQKRLETLKGLQREYRDQCDKQRRELHRLAEANGASGVKEFEAQALMAEDLLNSARNDLRKPESELLRLRIEERLFESTGGSVAEVPEQVINGYLEKEPSVQDLLEKQASLKKRLAGTLEVASGGQNSRPARVVLKELEDNRKALEARKQELRPEVEAKIRDSVKNDTKAGLADIRRQIVLQERYREALKTRVEDAAKARGAAAAGRIDLRGLEFDLSQCEDLLRTVSSEYAKLDVEKEDDARVVLHQPAVGYDVNPTVRKAKLAGMGGGGVLGLILAAVAFLEFRTRRVDSVDEVSLGLGLPVVGTLPAFPARGTARAGHWNRMLTEAADSARTMVLHKARTGGMRVVMVTSAVGGEGKTSLSGHLAVSLARAGRNTLLIDCDLRNPSCQRVFDLPCAPGVSELLRGEATPEEAVQATPAPGLSVLTAGHCDRVALQALSLGGIRQILDRLRPRFDFVVVDSSPILLVADGLLLAQQVDGVIFSVLRQVSRLPNVYAAQQRLANLGVPLLGAVVSGTREEVYGYGPRPLGLAVDAAAATERAS